MLHALSPFHQHPPGPRPTQKKLITPNNSKCSVAMKIYTTYHGSAGVPSTLGAVNPASITELILVDGHDAAAMHPLFDQNTNAHEPITQQVKEALTATERHDEHARARTLPQDSQFLQPPSSEWNVSQYIPCSNCELATQNREPRAAVSHTCMHASGIRSRTQVKAPKKTTPTLHKTPAYPSKSQRRGDHST